MTIFEFADGLNGREYGNEITALEKKGAKLPLTFVSGVVLYLTPDE